MEGQYLDLSGISQGVVRRDDRFGYVELATGGLVSPCFDLGNVDAHRWPDFIGVSKYDGVARVAFAVDMKFDLVSGKPAAWRRLDDFDPFS